MTGNITTNLFSSYLVKVAIWFMIQLDYVRIVAYNNFIQFLTLNGVTLYVACDLKDSHNVNYVIHFATTM